MTTTTWIIIALVLLFVMQINNFYGFWHNHVWLRNRIQALEDRVKAIEVLVKFQRRASHED